MNILIFNDDCKIFTEIIIILTLPFFLTFTLDRTYSIFTSMQIFGTWPNGYIYIQGQNIALLRQLEVGLPK